MKKDNIFFWLIIAGIFQINSTYTMQKDETFKRKVIGYSTLITSAIGFFSLADQLKNERYSWKQTLFTGGCLSASLVGGLSYFNLLSKDFKNININYSNLGFNFNISTGQKRHRKALREKFNDTYIDDISIESNSNFSLERQGDYYHINGKIYDANLRGTFKLNDNNDLYDSNDQYIYPIE